MSAQFTPQDLELITRPLHGFVTVAAGATPPQPRPVWYEVTDDGDVQFFTAPDSPKMRQLERDPRASLVVAAPVGERERWVSVAGPVTIESGGGRELLDRLAARYWDTDDPVRARELAAMQGADWVRVVIHPEKVSRTVM
ncbi:pyridoxamine 5'-phosphate oxidase family protein [Mycolicibacterium vaccae]|uniref:pyridoxamine 5'-phosphate oxidase family protein n=1 Tax=Mycolicibacterium vaccae TaxID=1810 RepID=UPI003CFC59BA